MNYLYTAVWGKGCYTYLTRQKKNQQKYSVYNVYPTYNGFCEKFSCSSIPGNDNILLSRIYIQYNVQIYFGKD